MKNLMILILLFFSFVWVNAQTEEQTLEWLNKKKRKFMTLFITVQEGARRLEINGDILHVHSDNRIYTKINWSGIKDVSKTDTKNQIVVIQIQCIKG